MRVLINGTCNYYKTALVMQACAKAGADVVINTAHLSNPNDTIERLAKEAGLKKPIILDNNITNPKAVLKELDKNYRRQDGTAIDGVIAPYEYFTTQSNALAHHLVASGLMPKRNNIWDTDLFASFKDKWRFRQKCNEAAAYQGKGTIKSVWAHLLKSAELALKKILQLNPPQSHVVFVPRVGQASIGVRSVELDSKGSASEIKAYVKKLKFLQKHPHATKKGLEEVVVVPFVKGEEFNIDGFIYGGQVYVAGVSWKTDIDRGRGGPQESGFISQGDMFLEGVKVLLPKSQPVYSRLTRAAEAVFKGMPDGVFHLEGRYDASDDRVFLIEPNLKRFCGGLNPDSLLIGSGIDIAQVQVHLALGLPPPFSSQPYQVAGAITLYGQKAGVFKEYQLDLGDKKIPITDKSEKEVLELINAHLESIDREWVKKELLPQYLNVDHVSPLRQQLLDAFDPNAVNKGLRVCVNKLLRYRKPGDVIRSMDSDYMGGAVCNLKESFPIDQQDSMAAVAEMVAAEAIVQLIFKSIVKGRNRTLRNKRVAPSKEPVLFN